MTFLYLSPQGLHGAQCHLALIRSTLFVPVVALWQSDNCCIIAQFACESHGTSCIVAYIAMKMLKNVTINLHNSVTKRDWTLVSSYICCVYVRYWHVLQHPNCCVVEYWLSECSFGYWYCSLCCWSFVKRGDCLRWKGSTTAVSEVGSTWEMFADEIVGGSGSHQCGVTEQQTVQTLWPWQSPREREWCWSSYCGLCSRTVSDGNRCCASWSANDAILNCEMSVNVAMHAKSVLSSYDIFCTDNQYCYHSGLICECMHIYTYTTITTTTATTATTATTTTTTTITAQAAMHAFSTCATVLGKKIDHQWELLCVWPSPSTLQTNTCAREYTCSMVAPQLTGKAQQANAE